MELATLLRQVSVLRTHGPLDCEITKVTRDSREMSPSALFVAIKGQNFDGHSVIPSMVAGAVVVEREVEAPPGITVVLVENTRLALAEFAAALEEYPSDEMKVVGLTGTNGKTTITTLVEQALRTLGHTVGRIGTTGIAIDGVLLPAAFTTPEAPELQRVLAQMRDAGCTTVLMEVSSIGLDMKRVHGTRFHTGVFTNLSHDHLDYHGTFEAYRYAKSLLFRDYLRKPGGHCRAIAWGEDAAVSQMGLPEDSWTFGFGPDWDWQISSLKMSATGIELALKTPAGTASIRSKLIGRFNALNLVASLAIGFSLDVPLSEMAEALGQAEGPPGRMERVESRSNRLVLVDYAHSPDALHRVLMTLQEVSVGRVGVVFGCGGDRDQQKRSIMGRVAEQAADWTVVTSDNPRTEDPMRIIEEIAEGFNGAPTKVFVERQEAIEWAIRNAQPGDVVLIAGKGHETYQEVNGVRMPFDDRLIAQSVLEAL